ncbi:aminoglycoside phosphotransferase family protein [Sabulicella rubraurantiaca]|uniref:aminoglycoside phosphotransferase family protein n=1 Tax=Sabulicella rubraurantiaca TaxID=2811429 RepID=UPI002E2D1E8C|nr:phosphotransferase [Sabulicella rubraurantiaca]
MVTELLARAGFAAARAESLPGDASKRYARLHGGPRPALLMETPGQDYLDAFLRVARHLDAIGVPAPAVLAEAPGAALVEDLGPQSMADALDAGADPVPLYAAAARTLAKLHGAPPPDGLPAWDVPRMTEAAMATFLDWWWPAVFGTPPDDAMRAGLRAALTEMLAPFAAEGFVHRDYFPANLVPTARGMAVIDFQDAARGHPFYDLVSLVEDARRDVSAAAREAALRAYGGTPDAAAMAALGAQRHLRVAALWVRLDRRDGKPHYLAHGPRCWAHLARALEHPATAPLRRFLDAHVPPRLRGNPA